MLQAATTDFACGAYTLFPPENEAPGVTGAGWVEKIRDSLPTVFYLPLFACLTSARRHNIRQEILY